jgi:membrane protein
MEQITARILERTPARLRRPVEVTIATLEGAVKDRVSGLAAEIAFWVLLSLPALALSVIAAIGVVGEWIGSNWREQLTDRVVEAAGLTLTATAIDDTVRPVLDQLLDSGGIGLVSVAFVAALWTTARALKVVFQATALAANLEPRKGWKDRLIGFATAFGAIAIGAVLAPLLLAGPGFGDRIAGWIGPGGQVVATLWRWTWWPVVIVGATCAIALIYHLGIPGRHRWRAELPGAVLATAVWLVGSGGLRVYGQVFMGADSVYGSMAGAIVALLWLWLSAFAVLLGVELNVALRRREAGT